MKLRARLALTTALVSTPLIVGLMLLDQQLRTSAAERDLRSLVGALAGQSSWRAACEQDPVHWDERHRAAHNPPSEALPRGALRDEAHRLGKVGGPGPHVHRRSLGPAQVPHRRPGRFYAYDEGFRPASSEAPLIPAQLRSQIQRVHEPIAVPVPGSRSAVWLLFVLPGSEHCRYVLGEGTMEPWLGGVLPPTGIWLAPLFVIVAAVLLSVGPFIRRLQRLIMAVEASAATAYSRSIHMDGNDEVAELGRAFDRAAGQVRDQLSLARQREQALRDFLANTTHDVMVPLTVLQGHLAQLRDGLPKSSERCMALAGAMDEAHYLGALLHNLSTAAKLDGSRPPVGDQLVDMTTLVDRVMRRHQPIAEQLRVTLNWAVPEGPVQTTGDLTMLEQAVGNLVYNAIRHNRAGGHAAVILEQRATVGFCLRVLDDGPGVRADELPFLSQRGFRGDASRPREQVGQGLGLHIVQRIADLHGLRLDFAPSEYGGLACCLHCGGQGTSTSVPSKPRE